MPRVSMKPDTLNLENRKFEQKRLTRPLFINSVPKSGTHLLRNIVRMFVPVEQQYDIQFIQHPNLQEHLEAFNPDKCNLSWGHLLFSDASAIELSGVRKIVLYRDPHSWVLARARFFLSDEFSGNIDHVKGGRISVEELLNLMILGIYQKVPSMLDLYTHNAVAWLGTVDMMVKYEDLVDALKKLDTLESEGMIDNARTVGAALKAGLMESMGRWDSIGDVRGVGLFIGIEFVDGGGAPDKPLALDVVCSLRDHGFLTSIDGAFNNMVKIRPPLPLQAADAAAFLDAFDVVMKSIHA